MTLNIHKMALGWEKKQAAEKEPVVEAAFEVTSGGDEAYVVRVPTLSFFHAGTRLTREQAEQVVVDLQTRMAEVDRMKAAR